VRFSTRWRTLPALVARHPEIRPAFTWHGWVWRETHARLLMALAGIALARVHRAFLVWCVPYVTFRRGWRPSALRRALAELPGLAAVDAAEVLRIEHRGRSAARNAGLERALGEVVLFIDDDVVASDDLLQRHLDHHRRRPEGHEALVGRVTWAPDIHVTPHMRWLERGGPLFAFDTIENPDNVDWRHFCTANASVKRSFLDGERFDEDLERAVDVELGYRLSRRGMRLRYDP